MFVKKKKIVIVTSTRADYGKLKTIIQRLQKNKLFDLKIFVTGMHNLNLYGKTVAEIKNDKIKNLYIYKNQTLNSSMNRILINTIREFSKFLDNQKPDLVMLHGDRIEPLGCAISSVLTNTRVVHVEGGEVSGTVDEVLRHSISKLSHIHFVSNKLAKRRLIQMGENKNNIFITGSPDVDIILSKKLPKLSTVRERYDIDFKNYGISILHPVTTNFRKIKSESKKYFKALLKSKKNFVVTYPNNDLGSSFIMKELDILRNNKRFRIIPSLRFEYFLTLLKNSSFIIGNSSCGIMEAPYYKIPTINIGNRQQNRLKSKIIINTKFEISKILHSIDKALKTKIHKKNYFGFGNSSKQVEKLLMSNKIWKINLQKNFIDLVK